VIRDIKGNGIYISNQNDLPAFTQSHFNAGRVEGNLITDIDVSSTGTSGQEGNAIVCWLANSVSVCNNTIRFTRWSGVRFNACSQLICSNNSFYANGDIGIYIEQPGDALSGKHPTGVTVVGNTINHCGYGISFTNFTGTAGNRLAVIANNVIRHAHKLGKELGAGIVAEGDASITGNVIECADYYGILLGTNSATRDHVASGNLIRDCLYGIGVSSTTSSGAVFVTGNLIHIANASTNAVVSDVYDPTNTNPALPNYRFLNSLAENQTANSWVKVTNNYRSTSTTPLSPSDGCELAPVF
jgi:uncharacterized secreted repeat protein (TIGR03808 family)